MKSPPAFTSTRQLRAVVVEPVASHQRWTCGSCGVEVRFAGSDEQHGLPANWAEDRLEGPVCLHCRRELAADAAVSSGGLSLSERARLRSSTIVDFEVRRTPDRTNTQIAGAVHTSVGAVLKSRERIAAAGSSA